MPVESDQEVNTESATEAPTPVEYRPGDLAPAIVTPSKVWKPESKLQDEVIDESVISCLKSLVETVSEGDQAARRTSVLQTWEERHFDRGYQFLDAATDGGWKIVGADKAAKGNAINDQNDANLYPNNVYSAQGDIVSSALCRGQIKVNFAAKNKEPLNVQCADECNKYKYLWQKNNEADNLQRELMNLSWTDCRGVLWTRSMVDKARFGETDNGELRVVEVTTSHGVLETKCSMMCDRIDQMPYFQVYEDVDYAMARAMFPWMGNKIKPSWGVFGQLEFERVARINTRIGVVGKYLTGTSGIRESTIGYTWLRPSMYFDDKVSLENRQWFLKNCPTGVLVILCGKEFCCCWEESMDDHLAMGMFTRGFGQNRRSLGSSDLPIQKRLNIWVDLMDKFIRAAIPFTMHDDQAFNEEAVSQQEASPSRFLPVAVPEGRPITDLIAASPAIPPQQEHMQMIQWFAGPFIQSLDGATPALFGGGEGEDNTVGATQIRLQQALERIGPAYGVGCKLFARACQQAARCCAENGNAQISDTVEGQGEISVTPANMKGEAECTAEATNGIPESGAQREAKIMSILDMAAQNSQVASLIATPSNAREIVKGLGIDEVISIDEADSEDKQLEEIEKLIESEPLDNPVWHQLNDQVMQMDAEHEAAKQIAVQAAAAGALPPDAVDAGEQMEQELGQLKQQLSQTPKLIPSVPVATSEDPNDPNYYATEDHQTEAATCFSWAQEPDGRAMRASKDPADQMHWLNFSLHWALHRQMAAKMAQQQQVQPKTSISIAADKLSGSAQQQALQKAGIQISQQDAQSPHEQEVETIQRTPMQELKTKTKRRL